MATRSLIAKKEKNGFIGIYCHWDGYPEHQLPILENSYNSSELVDQLIALGSISILGNKIGTKQNFETPEDEDSCLAYHRDKGEEFSQTIVTSAKELLAEAEELWLDYLYVFTENGWKHFEISKIDLDSNPNFV
jgi:hypothetical protein